jgi:hypothetical protein
MGGLTGSSGSMLSTVVLMPLDELDVQRKGNPPMKLRTRLLCYTAAIALSTSAVFAAIDGRALADAYLAEGYDFVEVKVGPTQTKVEAIKGVSKIEVIYDNETQAILKQEDETADGDDVGRTGSQVRNVGKNFLDDDDEDEDEDEDEDDDDDDEDDDHGGDHDDDDEDDNDDDDNDEDDDDEDDDEDDDDDSSGSNDD